MMRKLVYFSLLFLGLCVLSTGANAGNVTASFTANVSNGTAPFAVQFNDTSAGAPVGWLWNFQDGYGSNAQNPVHVFNNSGTFVVCLNVTDGVDYNETNMTITANSLPAYGTLTVSATRVGQLAVMNAGVTGLTTQHTTISTANTTTGPLNESVNNVVNGVKGGFSLIVLCIGILGAVVVLRALGYF